MSKDTCEVNYPKIGDLKDTDNYPFGYLSCWNYCSFDNKNKNVISYYTCTNKCFYLPSDEEAEESNLPTSYDFTF